MSSKVIELDARRPNAALAQLPRSLPPGEPAEQVKAILEMSDPVGFLQQLDSQVFYQLIKSAGWDQTYDLIHYATPEQLQNFIDFDCWTRDRLIAEKMDKWMLAMVTDASDEELRAALRELDAEVVAIYFKSFLQVEEMDEGRIPDHLEGDIGTSPDGVYAIVFPDNEDRAALLRALITRLYAVDRVLAWTLLEAVRWELMSEMEEYAYKWRNSRLEEFGFIAREEAVEVYSYIDPARFRAQLDRGTQLAERMERVLTQTVDLPAVLEDEFDEEFFVFNALAQVRDEVAYQRIVYQIGALNNRTMIADGVEPGEVESGREVARRTLGYLSLGLDFLSRADLGRAAEILSTVAIKRVFQVGFSLPRKLQSQLAALEERPTLTLAEGERYSLLNPDERALAESLDRPRPTFAWDWQRYEIFKSQDQLDHAAVRIGMLAFKQIWLFAVTGHTPDSLLSALDSDALCNDTDTVGFDTFFATWLARFILSGTTGFEPLDATDIRGLIRKLGEAPWDEADGTAYFKPLLDAIAQHIPAGSLSLFTRWSLQILGKLNDEFVGVHDVDTAALFQEVLLVRA